MKKSLGIVFFATIFLAVAFGQYYQNVQGMGGIDWTNGLVRATGIGSPNPNMPPGAQRAGAIEAAKQLALRNLLQMVKGMYLNSETTVENAITTNDVVRSRVEGIVRNFRVVDTRYLSDGSVEVDVEVPLSSFYDIIIPEGQQVGKAPLVCPTCGQPWPAGRPYPSNLPGGAAATAPGGQPAGAVYTGLIIDARGLNIRPALAPKVLDELGNEVYGTGYVNRDYAVQIGVVGYDKDLDRARQNERVKDRPLIVKGVNATGSNRTDVVISNADAQVIRGAAANLNFLQQCKVMIILD